MRLKAALLTAILASLGGCSSARQSISTASATSPRLNVLFVEDEPRAALAILEKLHANTLVTDADWAQLFSSEGYKRLKERETSLKRDFTDSAFKAFVMSDTLVRRTPALRTTLRGMEGIDVSEAARKAFAYLPRSARIVARLYPEIKPRTNSFVFGFDSVPGIFIYVDPAQPAAEFQNTLAHELHHIGLASACHSAPDTTLSEPIRTLVGRMGAFGEGLAMLAAAGSPDSNAHYESDAATRARWDRDVANHESNLRALEGFFRSVVDGTVTTPDSVTALAMNFYGEQGPWYTVGWKMAVTVERVFGRQRLIDEMCDPVRLLRSYNAAAEVWNKSHSDHLALWSDDLLSRLEVRRNPG